MDTWDDWCHSSFQNKYPGFPPDIDDPQPPVVFSGQVFWGEDIAEPSRMLPDCGNVHVLALQAFADPSSTFDTS